MKRKLSVADYLSSVERQVVAVPSGRLSGHVISAGALVTLRDGDEVAVIAAGAGMLDIDVMVVSSDAALTISALVDGDMFSLFLDRWPSDLAATGWRNTNSFAQLELKDRNTISPEVQAVIDRMNRNAMYREAKLQAAIEALAARSG